MSAFSAVYRRSLPLVVNPELRHLFVLNLVLGSAYAFVAPFLSLFGLREVGMSPSQYGVFMMATAVGGIALGTVLAHYSDKGGRRRTYLVLGSLAGAAGYAIFAYARTVAVLLPTSTLVLGISSITFVQLFAYAREKIDALGFPKSDAAFYLSAFRMFFALAWTIGPAIASWVLAHFGFKGLFLVAAANFALFSGLTCFYIPGDHRSGGRSPHPTEPSYRALRRWDMAAHFFAFVAVMCATTMGMSNLPLLIVEDLGGTPSHIGIAYSVAPLFELPFMLYCGLLATREDPARMIRAAMIMGVAYFGLLAVVRAPWQIYPAQILSAAITAVLSGVAITYFQSHLPRHPGVATNLYSTAQRLGSTLGYFMFGMVAQGWGHRAVFGTCAGLAAVALLLMQVKVHLPDEELSPSGV